MYQTWYTYFKLIESNHQINIFYSYRTLVHTDYHVSCHKGLVSNIYINSVIDLFHQTHFHWIFVGVCHQRQSWLGQRPPGGLWFWRKKIYFYSRLNPINGFVPQHPLRRNWPQARLPEKQVTLSPAILWVEEIMGSTFTWYIMGRWEENYHPLYAG